MKSKGYLKLLPYQSGFSKMFATWANNHNGWRKMKKQNRRIVKSKLKEDFMKTVDDFYESEVE